MTVLSEVILPAKIPARVKLVANRFADKSLRAAIWLNPARLTVLSRKSRRRPPLADRVCLLPSRRHRFAQ
jgi:hypothetical protein